MNRIKVDTDLCKGCYYCIAACEDNLISVGELLNRHGCYPIGPLSNGSCTACARCALVCPEAAIEVYQGGKDN